MDKSLIIQSSTTLSARSLIPFGHLINVKSNETKKPGLKRRLLSYLKDNGKITRKQAYVWSKSNHYEQATFERRARELVNEVGVVPLNEEGKRARTGLNEHICGWAWKPTTVLRKG